MSVAVRCHKGQVAEEPVLLNPLDTADPPTESSQVSFIPPSRNYDAHQWSTLGT